MFYFYILFGAHFATHSSGAIAIAGKSIRQANSANQVVRADLPAFNRAKLCAGTNVWRVNRMKIFPVASMFKVTRARHQKRHAALIA